MKSLTPVHSVAEVAYTLAPCSLGHFAVAATSQGVCFLSFADSPAQLEESLQANFPKRTLKRDDAALADWARTLQQFFEGKRPLEVLPLDMQGTPFQQRVWQLLQTIPAGETRTYLQIAQQLGNKKSVRAVARACATNPVSILVPCHRVVKSDGSLAGFRWGIERKRRLLELENRRLTKIS